MGRESKTGKIEVPGASLRYLIEGEGIPTIIVGDTIMCPRVFPQALRDHFKMAFLDLRMYSPETIPEEGLSLQSLADDVETFRKHLGWEKVVVFGYSIFGNVAINYVHHYSAHVTHLISIDAVPFGVANFEEKVEGFFEQDASEERKRIAKVNIPKIQELWDNLNPSTFAKINSLNGYERFYDPYYDFSWVLEGTAINEELFAAIPAVFNDSDVKGALETILIPKLMVVGRYDYACPYIFWDRIKDIPGVTIHLYEKSGHQPMFEEPEKFIDQTLKWVEER